jgi:hypothetical protein
MGHEGFMPAVLSGRGRQGLRQGRVPDGVFDNVVILCIASEKVAARVAAAQEELLDARPAIIAISDCAVLRADHFSRLPAGRCPATLAP